MSALDTLLATQQAPNIVGAYNQGQQTQQANRLNQIKLKQAEMQMQNAPALAAQKQNSQELIDTQRAIEIQGSLDTSQRQTVNDAVTKIAASIGTQEMTQEQYQQIVAGLPLEPQAKEALSKYTPAAIRKLAGVGVETKNQNKIREETRSSIRGQLKSISSETDVLKTNWTKLKNLSVEIKKGNRQAVPQALVSIVKLGDPGSIVSTNEMRGAINEQDPMGAVYKLLIEKGQSDDVAKTIARMSDPLNPDYLNTQNLLATGRATVSAFVPQIQRRYQGASELADTNLTGQGISALFSNQLREDVGSLSNLLDDSGSGGGKSRLTGKETREELLEMLAKAKADKR